MFEPFSPQSRPWEKSAHVLRRLIPVGHGELLDPLILAPKVGLRVIDPRIFNLNGSGDLSHVLNGDGKDHWSGGVFPMPLPDGTLLCMLNPTHSKRRNKITLMEEICHIHLRHKPSQLLIHAGGLEVRGYDPQQEKEAYGVGAAALLPWGRFFKELNAGQSVDELAEAYDLTTQLIEYRIKITGAYKLYQARQRTKILSVPQPG